MLRGLGKSSTQTQFGTWAGLCQPRTPDPHPQLCLCGMHSEESLSLGGGAREELPDARPAFSLPNHPEAPASPALWGRGCKDPEKRESADEGPADPTLAVKHCRPCPRTGHATLPLSALSTVGMKPTNSTDGAMKHKQRQGSSGAACEAQERPQRIRPGWPGCRGHREASCSGKGPARPRPPSTEDLHSPGSKLLQAGQGTEAE